MRWTRANGSTQPSNSEYSSQLPTTFWTTLNRLHHVFKRFLALRGRTHVGIASVELGDFPEWKQCLHVVGRCGVWICKTLAVIVVTNGQLNDFCLHFSYPS